MSCGDGWWEWGLMPLSTAKVRWWQTALVVEERPDMAEETTNLQRVTIIQLPTWNQTPEVEGP